MRCKKILILALLLLIASAARPQNFEWTRQFGTWDTDSAQAVFVDESGSYVVGSTSGTLPNQIPAGDSDAFIRKYDDKGKELWTKQFGTMDPDSALAVFGDTSGIYVAGSTYGTFSGQVSSGDLDIFIKKFDPDGNEIWTKQFGSSNADYVYSITGDDSGIYMAGATRGNLTGQVSEGGSDAIIIKLDHNGKEIWSKQFGTSSTDFIYDIALDQSAIYVAGTTYGTLVRQTSAGGSDAFIIKYDTEGKELWVKQFGTPSTDLAKAAVVDSSGIYLVGTTYGALPGQVSVGGADAFIIKFDEEGSEIWTRQFGTPSDDIVYDASYGIFIVGETHGVFPGQIEGGGSDGFIKRYNIYGNELWTQQFGNTSLDSAKGVFTHYSGTHLIGQTYGSLLGQFPEGGSDAFIIKIERGPNKLPTTKSVGDQTWYVGFANYLKVFAEDLDGDPITFAAEGLPSGVTMAPNGLISGTPTDITNSRTKITVKDIQGGRGITSFDFEVKITIEGIVWKAKNLNLSGSIRRSLLTPLEQARAARSRQRTEEVKELLEEFIQELKTAQQNKNISEEDAQDLTKLTRHLINSY
jgi:uncharacterized protein (UPF0548 family)